jgi:hypothetical protein
MGGQDGQAAGGDQASEALALMHQVGNHVRFVDPGIFLELMLVIERWVMRPYPNQVGL